MVVLPWKVDQKLLEEKDEKRNYALLYETSPRAESVYEESLMIVLFEKLIKIISDLRMYKKKNGKKKYLTLLCI